MGNRAVIITKDERIGVYVHWNGGRDSIEAFLTYCKIRNYRRPEQDNYGWASLVTVISNFFGNTGSSIGVDTVEHLDCDNRDNGVYVIENWEIVGRKFFDRREQDCHDLLEMLVAVDEAQPKPIGEEEIKKLLSKLSITNDYWKTLLSKYNSNKENE